jgi:hypothetical protein
MKERQRRRLTKEKIMGAGAEHVWMGGEMRLGGVS